MGCTNSKNAYEANSSPPKDISRSSYEDTQRNIQSVTAKMEIKNDGRVEEPSRTQTIVVGGYAFQFAFVSQRGLYPDSPKKPNQDSYSAIPKLTDKSAFFGVYDGHGAEGHKVAWYARDTLPSRLSAALDGSDKETTGPEEIITKCYIDTNQMLRKSNKIDDTQSGTTAISVLMTEDRKYYISNVGDSRAMLISSVGETLVGKALSNDQTPYRKDERERCKLAGARIRTMDQLNSKEPVDESKWDETNLLDHIDLEGDPPRIWLQSQPIPGCAFTRSIGDSMAEKVGCFAEPEISAHTFTDEDKYLILASDGVFEFIKITEITEILTKIPDPLQACKAIVKEAYDRWLKYEERTDDITIIIISCQGIHIERKVSEIMIDMARKTSATLLNLLPDNAADANNGSISRKAKGRMSLAAGTDINFTDVVEGGK